MASRSSSTPRSFGANPLPMAMTAISCAFSGSFAVKAPTAGKMIQLHGQSSSDSGDTHRCSPARESCA